MIAAAALGIFGILAALNLYIVARNSNVHGLRERLQSAVPVVGGAAGVAGFLATDALRIYAWMPVFLDVGTAGFLFCTLPAIAKDRWQLGAFNLLRVYKCTAGAAKTATLRLYKTHAFLLRLEFHRAPDERGISQFTRIGTWQETTGGIKLVTRDGKTAELSRAGSGPGTPLLVTSDFPTFQTDAELSLAGCAFSETAAAGDRSPA